MTVLNFKSREETKFLALLARTQEKASRLGVSKRAFQLKNGRKSRFNRPGADQDGGGSSHFSDSSSQIGSSNEQINRQPSPATEDAVYDWRLPKFVETLERWLSDLEKHPQGPRKDTLNEYKLKVGFLRKVVITLETEKLQREESAPSRKNSSSSSVDQETHGRKLGVQLKSDFNPATILPHGPATTGEPIAKEIHQKLEGRRDRNLRDQLFGGDDLYGSDFTENGLKVDVNGGGLDSLMKAHQEAQEKVAEEMLTLTRSLKHQSVVAGEIVRKDTQVIEKSAELAQQNDDKLKMETDRLMERNRSPCRCWIWFILSVVCFTFIAMVWIMKFFRKRRWNDEL